MHFFRSRLGTGDGVCKLLKNFTFGYVVLLGRFLSRLIFITSTLVCDVSLSKYFFGVFFCLNISDSLLIACSFTAPMVKNGAQGVGLDMANIKFRYTLISASWLDSPEILVYSVKIHLFL